jgi:uncharacterized protein
MTKMGSAFTRKLFLMGGMVSAAFGIIGIFLPIMPTVPFLILAAFCFARSNPALEARIMNHPIYGPPIRDWREKGVVSRKGKLAATAAFMASIIFGYFTLSGLWLFVPPVIAVLCLSWLWTRPET